MSELWSDLGRDARLLCRLFRERRWKFFRFALRRMVRGISTLHCRQCGVMNWHSTHGVCGSCGLYNIWRAIYSETGECE